MPILVHGGSDGIEIRTGLTPVPIGSATASFAFTFRMDPVGNATYAETPMLQMPWGNLTFTASESRFTWEYYTNDGTDHSNFQHQAIFPHVVYSMTFVMTPGSQKLKLNDVLAGAVDTLPGTVGAAEFPSFAYWHVQQVDGTYCPFTIQHPVMWSGYALTDADTLALKMGADPSTISPANIVLDWTLVGTDGVALTPGDSGLADQSATGKPLATIAKGDGTGSPSAPPRYSGTTLVYQAPAIASVSVMDSGENLAFFFTSRAGTKVPVTALPIDLGPTIRINGGAPIQLVLRIWGVSHAYQDWVLYLLPEGIKIHPGDVVTCSTVMGWATTTAGEVDHGTDQAVDNRSGGSILPAFVASHKNMTVSWNMGATPSPGSTYPLFANLAKCIQGGALHLGNWKSPTNYQFTDVAGYPTDIHLDRFGNAEPAGATVVAPFTPDNIGGAGLCGARDGLYTLMWDGAWDDGLGTINVSLDAEDAAGTTVTEITADRVITNGADNKRVFQFSSNPALSYGPAIHLNTLLRGNHNLRVYGPGVDGSTYYHPDLLRILRIFKPEFIRTVLSIDYGGGGNVAEFGDFTPQSWLFPNVPTRYIGGSITKVEPYDDSLTNYFNYTDTGRRYAIIKYTCPGHGISNSFGVSITINSGGPYDDGWFNLAGGGAVHPVGLMPLVLDADTFLGYHYWSATHGGAQDQLTPETLATTYTSDGNWSCFGMLTPGTSPADVLGLINEVGSQPHLCVPCGLSDDGVSQLADLCLSIFPPGTKVKPEWGNEIWNGRVSGTYCGLMGPHLGLSSFQYQARRSGEVHAKFTERFALAGRPSTDIIRAFGGEWLDGSKTQAMVDQCVADGVPMDEILTAPYIDNVNRVTGAAEGGLSGVYDLLSIAGLVDHWKLCALSGGWDVAVAGHAPYLTAHYPAARVSFYEGGFQVGNPASALAGGIQTWDHSGNGHHGVLHGTVLPSLVDSPWTGFGKALSFPGGDAYVGCGSIGVTAPFTLRCRFRRTRTGVNEALCGSWGNGFNINILFYIDTTDKIQFLLGMTGGTAAAISSVTVADTDLHELAGTWDGTDLILHLDGVRVGTTPTTGTPLATTCEFQIGASDQASPLPFVGIIDEVVLCGPLYTSADYTPATTPTVTTPTTLGLWHLDESFNASYMNIHRSHAPVQHPGAAGLFLYYMQMFEDLGNTPGWNGLGTWTIFQMYGDVDHTAVWNWVCFYASHQVIGPGTGANGGFDNSTVDPASGFPYEKQDQLENVWGNALATWAANSQGGGGVPSPARNRSRHIRRSRASCFSPSRS